MSEVSEISNLHFLLGQGFCRIFKLKFKTFLRPAQINLIPYERGGTISIVSY